MRKYEQSFYKLNIILIAQFYLSINLSQNSLRNFYSLNKYYKNIDTVA